jgi:hypothetical protein
MLTRQIRCTQCQAPLAVENYNSGRLDPCPDCHALLRVEAFRALVQPPRIGQAAEQVLVEGESSCFFHPAKKASVACDGCGRFICSVCDIELSGQHLCPSCLESGKRKGKLGQIESSRTLYDSLALGLATYPLLIFYLTLITAPMALYLTIRHWHAPGSVIGRGKWRFVVAAVLATLQIGGWIALFVALLT